MNTEKTMIICPGEDIACLGGRIIDASWSREGVTTLILETLVPLAVKYAKGKREKYYTVNPDVASLYPEKKKYTLKNGTDCYLNTGLSEQEKRKAIYEIMVFLDGEAQFLDREEGQKRFICRSCHSRKYFYPEGTDNLCPACRQNIIRSGVDRSDWNLRSNSMEDDEEFCEEKFGRILFSEPAKGSLPPEYAIPGIGTVNGYTVDRAASQLYYLKDRTVWKNTPSGNVKFCTVGNAVRILAAYKWLFVSEIQEDSAICLRVINLDTGGLLDTDPDFGAIVIGAEPTEAGMILYCSDQSRYEFAPADSSFWLLRK